MTEKKSKRTLEEYHEQRRVAGQEKRKQEEIEKALKPNYGRNSPVIGDNGLNALPGDNTKYLRHTLEVANMPRIDLRDVDVVQQRIQDYFECCARHDMKPALSGLGLALGLERRVLWSIKTGAVNAPKGLPTMVVEAIKRTYEILENMWENYMHNGKINPAAGVFMGVNNYGYVDVKQVNLAPATVDPLGETATPEQLSRKYLAGTGSDYETDDFTIED